MALGNDFKDNTIDITTTKNSTDIAQFTMPNDSTGNVFRINKDKKASQNPDVITFVIPKSQKGKWAQDDKIAKENGYEHARVNEETGASILYNDSNVYFCY